MDSQTRPRIVALGDLIVDVVASMAGPLAHASDRSGRIVFRQGGSAANAARSVMACGGEGVFIGAVGRDDWGQRLAASMREAGVESHLVAKRLPTARIVALVESSGERTFVTDRGAADLLAAADLQAGWFRDVAALHLPAYSLYNEPLSGAAVRAASLARAAGGVVSVDLASSQPIVELGAAEAWARVATVAPDVLFGNASELAAILDGRPQDDVLTLAPLAVVKLGARGCRILRRPAGADRSAAMDVATRPLAAADTTGAGDAFVAGFLVRWAGQDPGRRHHPATLAAAARSGHRSAARLLRDDGRRVID